MRSGAEASRRERVEARLRAAFAPLELAVEDESAHHAGHAGAGRESHFRVRVVSSAFAGRSRVERHRAVYAVLAEELAGDLHALVIEASAPGELSAAAQVDRR